MNLTASYRAARNFERITSNCNADKATVIRWNMRYVMIMNLYRGINNWIDVCVHVLGIMSTSTYADITFMPLLAIAFDKRSTFVLSTIFFCVAVTELG